MRSLPLHHLTMLSAHPLELINAAAAGDFEYCGIRLVAPTVTDTVVDVVGNPALVRQIDQRLRTTGVKRLDIEAIGLQPDTDVRKLVAALEMGKLLGANHVVVVGSAPNDARLFDNFCSLCQAAPALDMKIGLELLAYSAVANLDQAKFLVRCSQQLNAGLLIDALQFFRFGATCAEVATIVPALIAYLQICDGPETGPVTLEERRREAHRSLVARRRRAADCRAWQSSASGHCAQRGSTHAETSGTPI